MRRLFLASLLMAFMVACASTTNQVKVDRVYRNERFKEAMSKRRAYASAGSLWVDNSFYSDIRAREVGDIVTIIVREYAQSKDYGSTQTEKSSSFSSIIKSIFGLKDDVSDLTGLKDPTNILDVSGTGKFKGKGQIEQTSSLKTKVTAVVTEVLPNGNLVVEGRRTIIINGEKKIIGIRGIVRPQDIGPNNTVSSEALADAEIVYEGKGVVSKSQSPGLFTRLLLWLWPLI